MLTNAQTLSFFTNAATLGIPAPTYAQLANEGITRVDDLADFDKTTIEQIAQNLRKPNDRVANPDPGAPPGSTIPRPPYVFGAKSQKRMLEACELVRYYETTGRVMTPGAIAYDVIRHFTQQWKSLQDRRDGDQPEVPKITKALPVLKWSEAMDDYSNKKIGVRGIPLRYVIRPERDVPAVAPALEAHRPYSDEHGSVAAELIARASHDHANFPTDNAQYYFDLEEATRGTQYAASIKPFQRDQDGRGAYFALLAQFVGRDKWETLLKTQDQLLHTKIWKGQSNYSLERFIAQHRNAYVTMQQCALHVTYQLPQAYTRVGYLLDGIQTSDPGLLAAIANIKTDDAATGKRHNFEATAAYLLPYDPVALKRSASNNKRSYDEANISNVDAEVGGTDAGFGTKKGMGKTGVHLRYYKSQDYAKLPQDQKDELREWRKEERQKGTSFGSSKKDKSSGSAKKSNNKSFSSKDISSAVCSSIDKHLKNLKKHSHDDDDDSIEALINSLQAPGPVSAKKVRLDEPTVQVNASALKAIVKRVKNSKKG